MADAGLVVLVSFISPFRAERDLAREVVGPDRFVEAFVDTPLATAEQRDRKGLYARARRGEIPNFTGIDSPYEPPVEPDLHLATALATSDELVETVLEHLRPMLGRPV